MDETWGTHLTEANYVESLQNWASQVSIEPEEVSRFLNVIDANNEEYCVVIWVLVPWIWIVGWLVFMSLYGLHSGIHIVSFVIGSDALMNLVSLGWMWSRYSLYVFSVPCVCVLVHAFSKSRLWSSSILS